MSRTRINVGVISDTHGLARPEALAALQGSELIIHAGDVGAADVLDRLRAIALPITVAKVQIVGTHLSHEIIELPVMP